MPPTFRRILLPCLLVLLAQPTLFAQRPERVFYSSFRPEGWDIWITKDEGKSFQALTRHPALDYDAVLTPDGRQVVFTSERGGHPQLYIVSVDDTSDVRLLVRSTSMQDQAAISPDGRSIVFVSTHGGDADIYRLPFRPDTVLPVDQAVNLTRHPGGDFRPSFSPDGTVIAFCSDRNNPIAAHSVFSFARRRIGNLFRMDPEGGQLLQLTNGQEWEGSPSWSADGNRIYYYARMQQTERLMSMRPDGSGVDTLTSANQQILSPVPWGDDRLVMVRFKSQTEAFFQLSTIKLTAAGPATRPDTLNSHGMDVYNPSTHRNGWLVCHGSPRPKETDLNKGGFPGELFVAGQPESARIDSLPVALYGVRRAFVAPVIPGRPELIIDHMDLKDQRDAFTPWAYGAMVFPLLSLLMFLTGIVLAIRDRRRLSIGRLLVFPLVILGVLGVTYGTVLYAGMVHPSPLPRIRLFLTGFAIVAAVLAWADLRRSRRFAAEGSPRAFLARRYGIWMLVTTAAMIYLRFALHRIIDVPVHIARVNYEAREVTPLFTFRIDAATNPASGMIIDGKITPDGRQYVFTAGSFRAGAHQQGAIWSYDLANGAQRRLDDSPANDGFADMSADGRRMVFRSGRGGTFDIYLQDGETLIAITADAHKENFPAISSDGRRIVYVSDKEGEDTQDGDRTFDIYLHEEQPDGSWSAARKLTDGGGHHAHPHFSPDGEWVIYTTERYGIADEQPVIMNLFFSPQMYGEIVAQRIANGHIVRLTNNKWEEGAPLWVR